MRHTLKINSVVCKCRLVCTLVSRHSTKILVIRGKQLFFNRVFTLESKKWLQAPSLCFVGALALCLASGVGKLHHC